MCIAPAHPTDQSTRKGNNPVGDLSGGENIAHQDEQGGGDNRE